MKNDLKHPHSQDSDFAILVWLWTILGMIFLIVIIGGITRLTGSGLSMVDWAPIYGILPPITEEQWLAVFEQYQRSPQYQQVNYWMNVEDFKKIFFWEYFHRIFARLIGLVTFLPWMFFLFKGKLSFSLNLKVFVAFALGGLQGLLGWYMVKSGLVDVPAVSHFRLAAHLLLAFFVAQWIFLIILQVRESSRKVDSNNQISSPALTSRFLNTVYILTVIQIMYGAFMAGTRAGWLFPTFPKMNGQWIPEGLLLYESLISNFLHHHVLIHFTHRILGYLLLLTGIGLWFWVRKKTNHAALLKASHSMLGALLLQFAIGVATIVFHVPIFLAVAHQAGAFILLTCLTWMIFHTQRLTSR
jgi:heme a synthase